MQPPLPAWTDENRDRINGALELKEAQAVTGYMEKIRDDVATELVPQLPADRTLGVKAGAAALVIHADCGLANLQLQMIARDPRLDPQRRFNEYGEAFDYSGNFPSGDLHPALQDLGALLPSTGAGGSDDSTVERRWDR